MMPSWYGFNAKKNMEDKSKIINDFLSGRDPMERIISMECGYDEHKISIIYVNEKGEKRIKKDDFKPFVWAKNSVAVRMFNGDRKALKKAMAEMGISVKKLITTAKGKESDERLENGYKYVFYSTRAMNYQSFLGFFQKAGTPIYGNKKKQPLSGKEVSSREFLAVSPIEQYMISTGKRMFKGYDGYDELKRLQFDLETQGLNPEIHAIDQIGIRTNKGFEKIITITGATEEERKQNELNAIIEFLQILQKEKPDVIAGHNSENFDWFFIITRCKVLGTSLEELSSMFFAHPIYKKNKETVLKLGGEVEYYKPTIMWGHNIIDSLHAVRRAQAIDSNMKLANLKYVTKYLKLKKENRVYVKGSQISTIWSETDKVYAFNNTNGDYYKVTPTHELEKGYEMTSGRYIVERYLLDDIWETDKVELALNEANFLICKMLPTTFQRACTMGTAGIWKLIMLAWCFEQGLAIPAFGESKRFTGGLSRLLKTGYADRVVKLDYNSLYPSIMLTWNITNSLDISDAMLTMLDYVLTNRELYKGLKGEFGEKAKAIKKQLEDFGGSDDEKHALTVQMNEYSGESNKNDKKQLPLKILGNSMFGSFGAPNVFPFGNNTAAEKVTCIGRQSLRLMISHFTSLKYTPIVGDSFTPDTPLFIRYNDENNETSYGRIDIKPISELINNQAVVTDPLGREYDKSEKSFQVLCRSGWCDVNYIYRHKTDKSIYEVVDETNNAKIEVTEDHSLFNSEKKKIKPTEVSTETKLEYYSNSLDYKQYDVMSIKRAKTLAKLLKNGNLDRVPCDVLNGSKGLVNAFLEALGDDFVPQTKTCQAGIQFLQSVIK